MNNLEIFLLGEIRNYCPKIRRTATAPSLDLFGHSRVKYCKRAFCTAILTHDGMRWIENGHCLTGLSLFLFSCPNSLQLSGKQREKKDRINILRFKEEKKKWFPTCERSASAFLFFSSCLLKFWDYLERFFSGLICTSVLTKKNFCCKNLKWKSIETLKEGF